MSENTEVGYVHISYSIDPSGEMQTGVEVEGIDDIITQLGLLELAKDSLIQSGQEGFDDE